jgi:hypothetical protein
MAQPVSRLDRAGVNAASRSIVANQLVFTKIEYLLTENVTKRGPELMLRRTAVVGHQAGGGLAS